MLSGVFPYCIHGINANVFETPVSGYQQNLTTLCVTSVEKIFKVKELGLCEVFN